MADAGNKGVLESEAAGGSTRSRPGRINACADDNRAGTERVGQPNGNVMPNLAYRTMIGSDQKEITNDSEMGEMNRTIPNDDSLQTRTEAWKSRIHQRIEDQKWADENFLRRLHCKAQVEFTAGKSNRTASRSYDAELTKRDEQSPVYFDKMSRSPGMATSSAKTGYDIADRDMEANDKDVHRVGNEIAFSYIVQTHGPCASAMEYFCLHANGQVHMTYNLNPLYFPSCFPIPS